MASTKTYEYIWLDGYKPEPFMRSKVKQQMRHLLQTGRLMDRQLNRLRVVVPTAYFFQYKPTLTQMDMI